MFDLKKRCNYYFNEISKIPRGSKNEKAISDYIVQFAKNHHLKYIQDEVYNVIVYKEGKENTDPVLLQSHMDMVCEKNRDVEHDFFKDSLDLYEEEGYLRARETTLGADDGVGVAYMLAILEDTSFLHPPLECVFTVDEEEGMTGIEHLDVSNLKSKRMIGLDNTEQGSTYICAAGGTSVEIKKEMTTISNQKPTYSLSVKGLLGGHSAVCIQKGRTNANKLMGRVLYHLLPLGIHLVQITGGMKFNAIPRECFVTFCSDASFEKLKDVVYKIQRELKQEYSLSEPDIQLDLHLVQTSPTCFDIKSSKEYILMLYLLRNGCIERMATKESMPSLSLNLGIVQTEKNVISITYLIRSSLCSNRYELANELKEIAACFNAAYKIFGDYAGWDYDPQSKIRKQLKVYYQKHTNQEYLEEATHGGLEIGLLKGKIPDLDVVTFGAEIIDYHTPNERMNIQSFEMCYELLKGFLQTL